MNTIPEFDADRKSLPLFRFLTTYFPLAWVEMTKVSVVNNARYSPDREPADISWNRAKSRDHLGSAMRHLFDYTVDGKRTEPVTLAIARQTGIHETRVLAAAAWRICAALQEDAELALAEKAPQDELRKAAEIPEAPKSTIRLGGQHTIIAPGTTCAPAPTEGETPLVYDELPTCPGHRFGDGMCSGATHVNLERTSPELRKYFEDRLVYEGDSRRVPVTGKEDRK